MNSLLLAGSKREQWMMVMVVFITILLNGFGIFMIYSATTLDQVQMDTYNERLVPLSQLAMVSKLTENTRVVMLSALSLKDEEYMQQAKKNMVEVDNQLKVYEKSYMTPGERESYEKFLSSWKEYCSYVNRNIESIRAGKIDDAWNGVKKGEVPFNLASQELTKLIKLNGDIVSKFNRK